MRNVIKLAEGIDLPFRLFRNRILIGCYTVVRGIIKRSLFSKKRLQPNLWAAENFSSQEGFPGATGCLRPSPSVPRNRAKGFFRGF